MKNIIIILTLILTIISCIKTDIYENIVWNDANVEIIPNKQKEYITVNSHTGILYNNNNFPITVKFVIQTSGEETRWVKIIQANTNIDIKIYGYGGYYIFNHVNNSLIGFIKTYKYSKQAWKSIK
jgi:hypothetical protein